MKDTGDAQTLGNTCQKPEERLNAGTVAILMCTYNGARFLEEQLESFIAQTHSNWKLYVSDDGSTDETRDILERYRQQLGLERVTVLAGPRCGFGRNFMSLIQNSAIQADFYAFSDQDDIWFADKLERSLAALADKPEHLPAMYCSRTRLIDTHKGALGHSPLFEKTPTFNNALVQSIAGANTMLINHQARELLRAIKPNAPIVAHDWLTYLIVTGCGGTTVYDGRPTLDYRQHASNLIGANTGFKQRISRLGKMCGGRFSQWSDQNLLALEGVSTHLSPSSQRTLALFKKARGSSFLKRLNLMRSAGIYRQTVLGNISLAIATGLNKI